MLTCHSVVQNAFWPYRLISCSLITFATKKYACFLAYLPLLLIIQGLAARHTICFAIYIYYTFSKFSYAIIILLKGAWLASSPFLALVILNGFVWQTHNLPNICFVPPYFDWSVWGVHIGMGMHEIVLQPPQ